MTELIDVKQSKEVLQSEFCAEQSTAHGRQYRAFIERFFADGLHGGRQ